MARLLTTDEVCRLLRASPPTVRRAVKQGRLHPVRLTDKGRPLFWSGEIADFVESQLLGAASGKNAGTPPPKDEAQHE